MTPIKTCNRRKNERHNAAAGVKIHLRNKFGCSGLKVDRRVCEAPPEVALMKGTYDTRSSIRTKQWCNNLCAFVLDKNSDCAHILFLAK